jgi:hypothetical protein
MMDANEEHACCDALTRPLFDGPSTESDCHPSVTEKAVRLRVMISEMTFSQLSALSRCWGIRSSMRNAQDRDSLHDACLEAIDNALTPPDSDAHRKLIIDRFFGYCSEIGQQSNGYFNGFAVSRSEADSACRAARARSASPRVDLTVEHFDCPVCLESVPSRSTLIFPCCDYEVCKACVIQAMKVHMHNQSQMKCLGCSAMPSSFSAFMQRIERYADPADALAWKTQLALKHVPDCRQCPNCDRIHAVDRASLAFPCVTCKGCSHQFCFEHGDAHAGRNCPPPDSQHIESQMKITAISKECPDCKVPIERGGGCPHMRCALCACDWCWTCGKSWSARGQHRELFNTSVNDSKNWLSALLFFIICYFAGPHSVFSASNVCTCNARNRSAVVQWHRNNVSVSGDTLLGFWGRVLTGTVVVRSTVQSYNQGRALLTAYIGYVFATFFLTGTFVILRNCFCCAFGSSIDPHIPYYIHFRYQEGLPGPPKLTQQAGHLFLFTLPTAVAGGICVACLTQEAHALLSHFVHFHDLQRLVRMLVSKFETKYVIFFIIRLAGLFLLMPALPHHNSLLLKCCATWLICQLHMIFFFEANLHTNWSFPFNGDFLDLWSFLWGLAAVFFKLYVETDSWDCTLMLCCGLVIASMFASANIVSSFSRWRARIVVIQCSILTIATCTAVAAMLPL